MTIRAQTLNQIIQEVQDNENYGRVKDQINPEHYKVGGIEAIDYMEAKSTPEEFRGYLRLTALKYLSRAGHKDDIVQEYKKAMWFINKLIETYEKR